MCFLVNNMYPYKQAYNTSEWQMDEEIACLYESHRPFIHLKAREGNIKQLITNDEERIRVTMQDGTHKDQEMSASVTRLISLNHTKATKWKPAQLVKNDKDRNRATTYTKRRRLKDHEIAISYKSHQSISSQIEVTRKAKTRTSAHSAHEILNISNFQKSIDGNLQRIEKLGRQLTSLEDWCCSSEDQSVPNRLLSLWDGSDEGGAGGTSYIWWLGAWGSDKWEAGVTRIIGRTRPC